MQEVYDPSVDKPLEKGKIVALKFRGNYYKFDPNYDLVEHLVNRPTPKE